MKRILFLFIAQVLLIQVTYSQISGIHTIGTGGEFPTFNDAINTIVTQGVSDTLVFIVKPGSFIEQVSIDGSAINYTNGVKPITFTSQTTNPDDVVLKYSADTLNNYTVKLKDISYLTIDGITIQAIDTIYGRVLTFENMVDSTNIINNKIIGIDSANVNNQTTCAYLKNLDSDSIMYINFTENEFINGKDAISVVDWNAEKNGLTLNIDNNNLLSQTNNVIYLNNKKSIITNNYINSNLALTGIGGNSLDTFVISKNKIVLKSSNSAGISISGTTNIYNNFISITNGNYGIWCNNNVDIFNNTVLLKNTNYNSSCIENNINSAIVNIFNNCLININGEKIISNYSNDYTNFSIDYNNMYSTSSYFNFNDLINTIGGNANSVSFMPEFVSDTDLHTNSALLYQTGIAIPEITEDIDGEARNNPPCIGADEFSTPTFNADDIVYCYYDQYYNQQFYTYDIGQGYDSYQWSCGSDSSSIAIDTINSVVGNNQYTVTVTVGTNTYSDTVNILYDLPTAIYPTDYCINWGDSVELWAEPNLTYLWNNTDTAQNYIMQMYQYPTLEVTDDYGCKNRVSINNEVTQEPANFNLSEDTIVCYEAILEIKANNYSNSNPYDKYSYLWNTGDTTQTIVVDSINYSIGTYEFSVIITNLETNLQCESYDTVTVELKNCSGIKNISNNQYFSLFPNPASNKLQLIISNKQLIINDIQILDITGKPIFNKNINDTILNQTIDISNLENGIYLIKIEYNDNYYSVKQFVVKH